MKKIIYNTMNRTIRVLLVFVTLILLQLSCTEEFLEPEPLSFFAPENVYVNEAGFRSGLVTVRKDVKTDFYGNRNNVQLEYATSDYGYGIGFTDWTNITPSSGTYFPILPYFTRVYGYIKNTNVIISRIDDIEWEDQDVRDEILGTALFYRSWWYYRLITTYGDVPFIGYELRGPKLDFYTHSRWTILEKLIEDVKFASESLPETSRPGDINKYVALHFLSKLYLANSQFDQAIATATEVINGPYELMTERFGSDADDPELNVLWDLHRPENKSIPTNKESIWTVIDRVDAPDNAKTFSYSMRGYHAQWWYTRVVDSEGKQGMVTSGPQYYALGRANADVYMSPWYGYYLWNEFGYTWKNTPDLRRSDANWWDSHEILYNNPKSVDYGKPVNFAVQANAYDTLRLWPMPYHKTFYPHAPDYTGTPLGGNGDSYIFRLAEAYLIRAEAYFWKGDKGLAANDINVIRNRAQAVPVVAADIDINFIADERIRELFMEEFRHSELVRIANIMARAGIGGYSLDNMHEKNWWYDRVVEYNTYLKLGQIGPATHKTEPKYIYWPIDVSVITTNTMGVINQNRGFEGDQYNEPPLTTIEEEPEE